MRRISTRSVLVLLGAVFAGGFALRTSTSGSVSADEPEIPPATLTLLKTFMSELVEITPGKGKFPATFTMGDDAGALAEKPPHRQMLSKPFFIAKYEVPQNLYEAVMGDNPSRWTGPRNSVEMMPYAEAVQFNEKLTALLHRAKLLPDGEVIRLPSEVEWEYCCRAGTTTAYSFGDKAQAAGDKDPKATLLDKYGWHTGNAAGNDPPVGALAPNPWGLYDMHGYLSEFCSDHWIANYDKPAEGAAPRRVTKSTQFVIRGGSWKDPYPRLRSAARAPIDADSGDDAVGFRCVRSTK